MQPTRTFSWIPSPLRVSVLLLPLLLFHSWPPGCGQAHAVEPLEFRWPIPTCLFVSEESRNQGRVVKSAYLAWLRETDDADTLRVSFEDLEILHLESPEQPDSAAVALRSLAGVLAQGAPPILVSREGVPLEVVGLRETVDKILEFVTRQLPDSQAVRIGDVRSILESPTMAAAMVQRAMEAWNAWVGHWLGLEIQPGDSFEGRMDLPWPNGGVVPAGFTLRHLGRDPADSTRIHLEWVTIQEGDTLRAAVESTMRSLLARDLPGIRVKQARKTARLELFTDPATLLPARSNLRDITHLTFEGMPTRTQERSSEQSLYVLDPRDVGLSAYLLGRRLYRDGRLPESHYLFRQAARDSAATAEAHAWAALSAFYLGRPKEALEETRAALAMDACHAPSHSLLATLYNPDRQMLAEASLDSTAVHLQQAVACDSTDYDAWLSSWILSQRTGDAELQARSLHALHGCGFLTEPVKAWGRDLLSGLPRDGILLTNGDMDTYPAAAMQEVEGLRRDVQIVNISLLQAPWYAERIRERLGLPPTDLESERSRAAMTDSAGTEGPADAILADWFEASRRNRLRRPLAVAVTVPGDRFPEEIDGRLVLVGLHSVYSPEKAEVRADEKAILARLRDIDPGRYRGDWIAPTNRSFITSRSGPALATNYVAVAIEGIRGALDRNDRETAEELVRWAEAWVEKVSVLESAREAVGKARERLNARR